MGSEMCIRDRNGKQYVRVIVNEKRTLQGISYEVGVPVMAFGSHVEQAKGLSKGDILKAICDRHEVKGKASYTILKIVRWGSKKRMSVFETTKETT